MQTFGPSKQKANRGKIPIWSLAKVMLRSHAGTNSNPRFGCRCDCACNFDFCCGFCCGFCCSFCCG